MSSSLPSSLDSGTEMISQNCDFWIMIHNTWTDSLTRWFDSILLKSGWNKSESWFFWNQNHHITTTITDDPLHSQMGVICISLAQHKMGGGGAENLWAVKCKIGFLFSIIQKGGEKKLRRIPPKIISLQGSAKWWALGCVKSPPPAAARGSWGGGIHAT